MVKIYSLSNINVVIILLIKMIITSKKLFKIEIWKSKFLKVIFKNLLYFKLEVGFLDKLL